MKIAQRSHGQSSMKVRTFAKRVRGVFSLISCWPRQSCLRCSTDVDAESRHQRRTFGRFIFIVWRSKLIFRRCKSTSECHWRLSWKKLEPSKQHNFTTYHQNFIKNNHVSLHAIKWKWIRRIKLADSHKNANSFAFRFVQLRWCMAAVRIYDSSAGWRQVEVTSHPWRARKTLIPYKWPVNISIRLLHGEAFYF